MPYFFNKLIRKIIVPIQSSNCATCGLWITERRRRPCGRCGGMNRDISRHVREDIGWRDLAG